MNRLRYETSPYLLQHKDDPVDWHPWGREAFEKAKREDKPIFLSVGYSTCHWCHVMKRESFEDGEIAELLNRFFVSVKVDREERPDVDSIYMSVCQALTGRGGWPMSVFMTAEQKPFFAGSYFPKTGYRGVPGFRDILIAIHESWKNDRDSLLNRSERVTEVLSGRTASKSPIKGAPHLHLIDHAVHLYAEEYDAANGGFGPAPKFPSPHNVIFLLSYYRRRGDETCLDMAKNTLVQMYRGGLFDHIGGGFCRYSTDERFLVPHFEKMLYDNALLISAYCNAYTITKKSLYLDVAKRTADFVLREMTSPDGGFYSALDADSDGEEGKYYLFTPEEITDVLGRDDGEEFNRRFGITKRGNFEGKSIPNLLDCGDIRESRRINDMRDKVRDYRQNRHSLLLDDKILTARNCLMITALCELYLSGGGRAYLDAAKSALDFINSRLTKGNVLFSGCRNGRTGKSGFLDDYASYISALLAMYRASLDPGCLEDAKRVCERVIDEFADKTDGGFYLYGEHSERLIFRPKEVYDGATPSGNSVMARVFTAIYNITSDEKYRARAEDQLNFIAREAVRYPAGYSAFLTALLEYHEPPAHITIVGDERTDAEKLSTDLPSDASVLFLDNATEEYPLKNHKATFYVCRGQSCLPPTNDIPTV